MRAWENSGRRTRIGTEHADYVNYEKLERGNLPTSFRRMSTARERTDIESTQKRRRYISSEKTIGEKKEGRKEGRTKSVARKEGAREGDESIRVSPRSI